MTSGTEGQVAGPASRALAAVTAALVAVTALLAAVSIPVGLYTILFTTLSPGLNANALVNLFLWFGPLPFKFPFPLEVGTLFVFVTLVYVLLLALAAATGPSPLSVAASGFRRGAAALMSNGLIVTFIAIGFLSFTATAIDSVVATAGVQIGGLSGNALGIFLSASTAPLVEELGFRAAIIGLVALLLSLGRPWKSALKSLWRPASAYESDELRSDKVTIVWITVIVGGLAFGLAHVSSGSGWDLGKLPEATYGGLVLGYLYVKYGFHVAVLTHWGVDYLGSVFAFFGQGAYGIPWTADPGYVLQQVVTYDLLAGIGIASFVLVAYLGILKLLGRRQGPGAL